MGINYFVFDGRRSTEWGVWISGGGTYNAPARDLEAVSIPGVNGDYHFDNGRFYNAMLTYPAFISKKFERVNEFRAWLAAHYGYYRLEDTYHPDEFRMAAFHEGFDAAPTALNRAGSFDVVFDCKPQRWLKSGEIAKPVSSGTRLFNPTQFEAKPLIRAYGSGTATVNGYTFTLSGAGDYADIDCELQEVYRDSINLNDKITLAEFPVLSPGENLVTFTGFTSIRITPRWWTL